MGENSIVERPEVRILFRRVVDDQEQITQTWASLEAKLGALRGRKFYGLFDSQLNEYWVCFQRQESDDPLLLELEDGVIPGGRYATERLVGEPPDVYKLIKPTIEHLAAREDHDPSRPEIEFYRRHDLIDLYSPVK